MTLGAQNPDPWQPCPPGTFCRWAAERQSLRRRRQVLQRLAVAAAGTIVLGTGGLGVSRWLTTPSEYHYGGIACHEVADHLPDYRAGRLDGLLAERIALHLAACPQCGTAYRRHSA